jgi:hypothetical protein
MFFKKPQLFRPVRKVNHALFVIGLLLIAFAWFSQHFLLTGLAAQLPVYPPDTTLTLVSDPSLPRPGYLSSITDPVFKTNITRVSSTTRHQYAKIPVWNSDQTRMILSRDYPARLLDGSTFADLGSRMIVPNGIWSNTRPDYMWGTSLYSGDSGHWYFKQYQVSSATTTNLHDFGSTYNHISIGEGEGNADDNDHYIALYCQTPSGGIYVVIYDLYANTVYRTSPNYAGHTINWCGMSHSGNYVAIQWQAQGSGSYQGLDIYTKELTYVGKISNLRMTTHGDFAYDQTGQEVYVMSGNCTSDCPSRPCSTQSAYYAVRLDCSLSYAVIARNDAAISNENVISGRNTQRPGWVYIGIGNGMTEGKINSDEAYGIKLDPSISPSSPVVERFAHCHKTYANFAAQVDPVPSRDGSKVIFASDWETGTTPVYSYVAQYIPGLQAPSNLRVISSLLHYIRPNDPTILALSTAGR